MHKAALDEHDAFIHGERFNSVHLASSAMCLSPCCFQVVHGCPDDSSGESCKNPVPPEWRQLCSFDPSAGGGWAKAMICDDQRKQGIVKYVRWACRPVRHMMRSPASHPGFHGDMCQCCSRCN